MATNYGYVGLHASMPDGPAVVQFLTDLAVTSSTAATIATNEALALMEVNMKEILSWPGFGIQWPGQVNPSSAPGQPPAKQSEDGYADSWVGRIVKYSEEEVVGCFGTDEDQATRLEYGFVGTDSLGRRYNQAPRPHVAFVVDPIVTLWEARLVELAVHD